MSRAFTLGDGFQLFQLALASSLLAKSILKLASSLSNMINYSEPGSIRGSF